MTAEVNLNRDHTHPEFNYLTQRISSLESDIGTLCFLLGIGIKKGPGDQVGLALRKPESGFTGFLVKLQADLNKIKQELDRKPTLYGADGSKMKIK